MKPEPEGIVKLDDVPPGSVLNVITRHTCYVIRMLLGRIALISGHAVYCPQPVLVTINGSGERGSWLRTGFISPGMRLRFHHPEYQTEIITSTVREIRECPEIDSWSMHCSLQASHTPTIRAGLRFTILRWRLAMTEV